MVCSMPKTVGDLGLDAVLSNPYLTRLIAKSKKKTDRFDAHQKLKMYPTSEFFAHNFTS